MKLLGNTINGKLFRIIYNLYQNIKSCVMYAGNQSAFFQSYCGVRQGKTDLQFYSVYFLNDLESYLDSHHHVYKRIY